MQANNDLVVTISTSPSVPAVTFSSLHQVGDNDSIPDIEDIARLPSDDALLPDMEDYFTTGAGSWGPATLPVKSFSGFKPPAISSSKGGPVNSPVGSSGGSSSGSPQGSSTNSLKSNSVLQPSVVQPITAESNPAADQPQQDCLGQGKVDAWEIFDSREVEGKSRGLHRGAAVGEAGVHQGLGQVRSVSPVGSACRQLCRMLMLILGPLWQHG